MSLVKQTTVTDGRYALRVYTGGPHTEPLVMVRRTDLKSSKWSAGNVTPALRARALELVAL